MKNSTRKYTGSFLSFLLTALYIMYYFQPMIFDPGNHFFSNWDDGLKNFYTFQYALKWGQSFHHFEGLNYPFGELLIFADAQPFLCNLFNLAGKIIPAFNTNGIFILNTLMLISIPVCATILFLILNRFRFPFLYTLFASVGIAVMSPQLYRISGHYALAYCFFIPWNWYLFIRYSESLKKWTWTIVLSVNTLIWFFIQPYYGMITSVFWGAIWLVQYIQIKKISYKLVLNFILQVIVPVFIFKLYLFLYDNHPGRIEVPWGHLAYNARAETVFIPHHKPVRSLVEFFWEIKGQCWEGWAYVGLPAVLACIAGLFRIFLTIKKKKYSNILIPNSPLLLRSALWASVMILLFSMGYPHKISVSFFQQVLPFFKQFRGLGRFAWVFFYVINVYAFWHYFIIARNMRRKKKGWGYYVFPFFYVIFLFIESGHGYSELSRRIFKQEYTFEPNDTQKNIIHELFKDDKKYQAIIPLPVYHVGTEKFSIVPSGLFLFNSMQWSAITGLPIMASYMSRTSIPESESVLSFLGFSEFHGKIPHNKLKIFPFLIIWSGEKLNKNEMDLINKSQLLVQSGNLRFYEYQHFRM